MKSPNQSKDDSNIKVQNAPKIRKKSLAPPGINLNEKSLFDSTLIESNATHFNIIQPDVNSSETILRYNNPKLLAIGNKSKISKSYNKSPKITNLTRQSLPPITQGITSLLTNKPLADLPKPPMEVMEASKIQEEAERLSIDFHEDPVAYFSKRKDGRGHLFIYMKHAKEKDDPDYSPYELVKIPHSEVKRNYFTMSANGVTHVDVEGNTEHFSLDTWAREESIFKSIRKLKFFQNYYIWKPLRLWRCFIMKQRFNEILDRVIDQPTYYNASFPSVSIAFSVFKEKLDKIIMSKLLCLYSTKKYEIDEFTKQCETNLASLKDEFTDFISDVSVIINHLNQMISDPHLLKVRDNEFDEIRRKNPNISQLVVLERKKDSERIKRKEQMNSEVSFIANYLRMIDYMLLESLRESCFKAFRNAEVNCMQEQSAIFQIDLFFTENGEVSFKPSIEELTAEVSKQLKIAFKTMEELPRLLKSTSLRHILRNSSNIDIPSLFEEGPDFSIMTSCSTLIQEVEDHITKIINDAFKDSLSYANYFIDFYPLYDLGKSWNVRKLIVTSSGEIYNGPLSLSDCLSPDEDDEFLLHPERAPIVDFDAMKKLLNDLNFELERVGTIKAGNTRGILHVDSRNLKMILTPIPMKAISDIHAMLKDLMNFKTEVLNRVFKSYILRLKTEPTTLQSFVDFCELLSKTTNLIPQMKKEITFIDDLITMIIKMGYETLQNQLYTPFNAFQIEQENAMQVKTANYERFEFILSQLIKQQMRKVNKYKDRSINNIPTSVHETNCDFFSKQTTALKMKVEKFIPAIRDSIRFQEVLNSKTTDFPEMDEIQSNIDFAEKLIQATRVWDSLSTQIKDIPFAHINMDTLIDNSKQLEKEIENIREMIKKPSPFLSELSVDLQEFSPYLEQLQQLSQGRMQTRHWMQLFDECGQEYAYNPEITIHQLLSLGILANKESIKEITLTAQGEYRLEADFSSLKSHWDDVDLPINEDIPETDNDVRLGHLDTLLGDIDNTSVQLNSMMSNKFVQGIYENVYLLAQNLNNIIEILDKWQKFEKNWVVISNLKKKTELFDVLPGQEQSYEKIEEKWKGIIEHIRKNRKLFHVFSYQTLLDDFIEFGGLFETIFDSLSEFVDKKRESIPRLYFLSNDEIINLYSTTDFCSLSSEIVKMMMNITSLDMHSEKASVMPNSSSQSNFPDLKINGLIGEDGDNLTFMNSISCSSHIDEWIPTLFTSMKESTKEAVAVSLSLFSSTALNEWIMSVTSYIAVLTINVTFTRDIEDCFNNLEANPKGFINFQSSLRHKINDLINLMTTPLSKSELGKVSALLTNILFYFEKTKMLSDRVKDSSASQTWHDTLKYKYDTSSMDITILFGDNKWSHGHEFWGKVPKMMITPTVEHTLLNMCQSRVYKQIPLIFGPFGAGKNEIIRTFAFYLGKYVFSAASFPSFSNFFCSQVLKGAALSGSWVLFSEIDQLNPSSLSFMFDSIRAMNDSLKTNLPISNPYLNFCEMNSDTRIFLTTSLNSFLEEGKIPPQLRSYVRPISLSSPLVKRIIETKLITCGFLSSKEIADQLEGFVSSVIPLFNLTHSKLQHCLKIASAGQDLLRQLMHSNKVEFINYYEDSRTAEHFSIARSAFDHFQTIIEKRSIGLLIKILYSHFRLFESFIKFQNTITNPCNFYLDKVTSIIGDVILEASKTMGIDFPINYLIEKANFLFQMMMTSNCIIICGPPNSGKSLLIELMEKVYYSMISDADVINHFKGIRPWKICTIYQNSNTWDKVFGNSYKDRLDTIKWSYGTFQTALTNLNFFEHTHHRILRFDGYMTNKFSKFLYQFVSEDAEFRINSLGSFPADSSFHCIVETDDVCNLTPELLSVCGILPMKSLQVESVLLHVMKSVKFSYPSFPFSNVCLHFKGKFSDEEFSFLLDIFSDISPYIIEKVISLPCLIDIIPIADKYSEKAGIYGLQYILNSSIKVLENGENAKFLMIRGFFDIFSSILQSDKIDEFDTWLVDQFNLPIPADWSEFEVTEQFLEAFPKPKLATCQIYGNKISPIDHSLLTSRVLVDFEEKGSVPLFIDDFVIPNPNFLIPSVTFNASIQTHSNVLLFGPSFSGKSSILSFMLHNSDVVCPIEIILTPIISTDDIIEIIQTQTNLVRKLKINLEPPKLFALVFSNIDSANISVLEFIRQLMATKKIQLTSHIDPKMLDEVQIEDFFVVIKATDISKIPSRFISHFTPIQLLEYPTSTKMYICKKAMNAFGINSDLIEIMNIIIDLLHITLSNILTIIILVSHLPQRAAASEEDKIIVFQVILSEIFFICFNCDNSKFDEFLKQAKPKFNEHNFGDAQEKFENDKIFAVVNYHFTQKIGKFTPKIIKLNDDSMMKKLSDLMHSNVSELTLSNFIKLSISLLKPGNHCIISSITGSARIALCKLFSSVFGFNFVDLNEEEKVSFLPTIKKNVHAAITENKTQLFVMRVNESNISEYNLLCSIFGALNIGHLFTIEEIDSLVQKCEQTEEKVEINKRREWMNKFKFIIKCKCRLVIAKDCQIIEDVKIFDKVRIIPPTMDSICENYIEKQNLRSLFISIWEKIDKFLPIHHVNQFYDFIKTFLKFYDSPVFESHFDITTALDFTNRLSSERSVYIESINSLQPELDSLKKSYNEQKKEIDAITSNFKEKRSKMNDVKQLKEKELRQKKNKLSELEEAIKKDEPALNDAIEEISKLTEKDVGPIKLAKISSFNSLKMILEILCILRRIGKDKTEEMLNDPSFPQLILEIKPEKVTHEMINQIKNYLNQEDLQKESMENVAPILSTILQFIQAIFNLVSHRFKLQSTQVEIEIRHNDLNAYLAYMEEEGNKIDDEDKSNKPTYDAFNELKEKMEKAQNEFNSIYSQKMKIDSILNGLDDIFESWKDYNEKFDKCNDKKCGDSILCALYLSYCGVCSLENRREIIKSATEELLKANIATSFKNPYEEITAKLTRKLTVTIANVELPQNILIEIEHIFNAPQPPLLIDPDGIIINSFLNANKAFIISVNSQFYESALTESMKDGKTLFITDVDNLHQRVSIISRLMRKSGEITLNNVKFSCNPNFRPIYVTNINEPEKIPVELLTRTTVINAYPSCLNYINNSIRKVFVNHFEPIHVSTLADIPKAETARNHTIIQSENEILQLIHKMSTNRQKSEKYSYLDDNETIDLLADAKKRYDEAKQLIKDTDESSKNMEKSLCNLSPIITLCNTMWFCLSRYMPKVQPYYKFSFSAFHKTIYSALHTFGTIRTAKLSDQQLKDVRKGLLDSLLRSLYPSLSLRDTIFFMFLTSFLSQHKNLSDLSQIIENLNDKIDSKYITEKKEEKEDSETDIIEKLKTVDISHFFDFAMTFVLQFFGDDLMNNFPIFQVDQINSQISTTPTMIFSSNRRNDVTSLIISHVMKLHKMDNFLTFSLSDDPIMITIIFDSIKQAMNRGSWVLLHYWTPSIRAAELLNEMLFLLHSASIHNNFRLIINAHTVHFLSPYLVMESNKLMIESYPSIKQTMKAAYDHFSSQIVSDNNVKVLKRLFYFSALTLAAMNFRSFVKPIGFKMFKENHITSLQEIIDYVKPLLLSESIPMRSLREFVQEIAFGSQIIETQDRRCLRAVLSSIYRNFLLGDSFTFLDQSSDESSVWVPVHDGAMVTYQNHSKGMPLFQTTDILMVHRKTAMPVLRWNMSLYLSKPFLAILEYDQIRSEKYSEKVEKKFKDTGAAIPSVICSSITDPKMVEADIEFSPILLFWINEIDFLNDILIVIEKDVKERNKSIEDDLMNDRVPSSWLKVSHLPTITNLKNFLIYLGEKRKFLIDCLEEPFVHQVNVRLIDNLQGFFAAYRHEFAFREGIDSNGLSFEFSLAKSSKSNESLILNGLYALNGKIENDILVPPKSNESAAFYEFPPLRANLTNMPINKKGASSAFLCPLYKYLFMEGKIDYNSTLMFDGETQNYIMDVILPSECGDRYWLLNSTALYCHVPRNFV